MPAPAANTNAEKWTPEATEEKLQIIEDYSLDTHTLYIGQALVKADVYEEIWSYWKKKWKDNEGIIHRMKILDQRFKNKLIYGALTGRLHAGVSKLLLRSNYGVGVEPEPEPKPEPEPEAKPHEVDSKGHIAYLSSLDRIPTAADLYPDEDLPAGEPYHRYPTTLEPPANGSCIRLGDGRCIMI